MVDRLFLSFKSVRRRCALKMRMTPKFSYMEKLFLAALGAFFSLVSFAYLF